MRAIWVDTNRSVVEWNVPMLRARECRSAADAALGANGSCTWTKSKRARSSRLSIVRDTSTGSDIEPPRRPGRLCPTASTDAHPLPSNTASGSSATRLIRSRDSLISSRESDGPITTTRCPRPHSSSERRSTNRLTSWCCSQGYGVTWAIENRSGGTPGAYAGPDAADRSPSTGSIVGSSRALPP